MSEMMSPDGCRIKGTLDIIPAVAVGTPMLRSDGKIDVEYCDQTDVDYNGQRNVERFNFKTGSMERVFLDDDGHEWLESELVPVPDAE